MKTAILILLIMSGDGVTVDHIQFTPRTGDDGSELTAMYVCQRAAEQAEMIDRPYWAKINTRCVEGGDVRE